MRFVIFILILNGAKLETHAAVFPHLLFRLLTRRDVVTMMTIDPRSGRSVDVDVSRIRRPVDIMKASPAMYDSS